MDAAHLHLIFNHLPIITPIIGLLVLIGGFIFGSDTIKRTAFAIFIFGAITTIAAGSTGEGAEEIVEHLEGFDHHLIHEHEEAAERFVLLSYLLGVLSVVGLWANIKEKSFAKIMAVVIAVFSAVVLFFAQQAGQTGGEIRHSEIRVEEVK